MIIWQQTNKQKDCHLVLIWWPFGDYLLIIKQTIKQSRLANDYLTTNKQTNKQTNKDCHLVIIWWQFDDYLTNTQTKLIIWWSFDDYLLIFWQQTNNQTIKDYKYLVIICLSFNDHIMTMNKQTNKHSLSSDDYLMIIY